MKKRSLAEIAKERNWLRRGVLTTFGVLCLGLGIAFFRTACLGSDPLTCFDASVSYLFGISYGAATFSINVVLFIVLLLFGRKFIGYGTVLSLVAVGYSSDFFMFLIHDVMRVPNELPLYVRIFFLLGAFCIVWFALALYISPDFGLSPYEGFSYTIKYRLNIPFKVNRVIVDLFCLITGGVILYCVDGFSLLLQYVNIGTVIMALCTGPVVSFLIPKIKKRFLAEE